MIKVMSLQEADWHDILHVLHETVHIWSAGLSAVDYQRFLNSQLSNPWFRKNFRFLVRKVNGAVQASCKLYAIDYYSRGRHFRLAGVGAVYTQLAFRKMGCATVLLNDVIDLCEDEEFDGIVLYSEIDPDFYSAFGFEELGSADFTIETALKMPSSAPQILPEQNVQIDDLSVADIPCLSRHYDRWLREQPFGVQRSPDYWHYKISKETFLSGRSRDARPPLQLYKLESAGGSGGYAIVEANGENLRILEIVGGFSARKIIWANLLCQILKGSVKRLRGWEALIRDLEPTYKIRSLGLGQDNELGLDASASAEFRTAAESLDMFCSERDWGRGMILSLNPELNKWLRVNPCPMLELDHL